MSKVTGTVKWFSNRKGFGFIEPKEGEDIFCHQTSIVSAEGEYRTLVEGMEVEFEIEKEESGKLKAMNVTAPGGGPVKAPKRDRKRGPRKGGRGGGGGDADGAAAEPAAAATNGKSGGGAAKEKSVREPPFHDVINEEAKAKITGKGVELGRKMTIDVALDQARIKLGQGGYAGLAHGSGMVGEGTYVCDSDGLVQFTWERCLKHADGKWSLGDTSALIQSFSLVNDAVKPVAVGETAETLWGADKGDPKDAFAENGFKMKRVVLTRPPGGGGRGRRGGGGKKEPSAAE